MSIDDNPDLNAYLDRVAAGTPTPGGGSVAAVVGALAAALGEMVVNLTVGREKYEDVEEALRSTLDRLQALRATLLGAAAADESAYQRYRNASSLPRNTDAQKMDRASTMQRALTEATDVPLSVARAAREVAELLEIVARDGNPHLRSDVALGAILSDAALRGALLNVRGNAALLKDLEVATTFLMEADSLEVHGREAAERAYGTASGAPAGDRFR